MAPMTAVAHTLGTLHVLPFTHPQGCRTYLLSDVASREALVLDVHLDLVDQVAARIAEEGLTLRYIVDSHTHADHPSGAGALLVREPGAIRVAHEAANHEGVVHHPSDGESLTLGQHAVVVEHAPGHTPDHIVLRTDRAFFSGDTLFIGGVARTDFLGGDAGQLFDTIHRLLADMPDDLVLFPGHDYQGNVESTIGHERANNRGSSCTIAPSL